MSTLLHIHKSKSCLVHTTEGMTSRLKLVLENSRLPLQTYHCQLPADIAHSYSTSKKNTRQPWTNIKEIWRCVSGKEHVFLSSTLCNTQSPPITWNKSTNLNIRTFQLQKTQITEISLLAANNKGGLLIIIPFVQSKKASYIISKVAILLK